ncbi:MAG: formylglycine-generating enzyme family protein [Prochloraceae cyanobacterium]|nr:formylglycine-generating enzyme family protein [Prochloraceae cyanobacterium]
MNYLNYKKKKAIFARRKLLKLALSAGSGLGLAFLGQKLAVARQDRAINEFDKQRTKQTLESELPIPPRGVTLERFEEFETVIVDRSGKIIEKQRFESDYFTEELGYDVNLEMVAIPGGTYRMGAPVGEEGSIDRERPQHRVEVPPFFISRYPVTQAQWRAVASLPTVIRDLNLNPSRFQGDNLPVEQIAWGDAVEFCRRLSERTRSKYRLPSEAEWEYACRAGTITPFYFGETITSELANYRGDRVYDREPEGEYRETTTPVGSFPPNAFGLYDMHGNVWEWCADMWYRDYNGAPKNGKARTPETDRGLDDTRSVLRGGSWQSTPVRCRSAYRTRDEREDRVEIYGFRVVCESLET